MDIATLLGSYAFPVVACLGMAWYVKYITDKNSQETAELNKQHTTIMLAYKDEIKDAINNNTLVMERLCTTMEKSKKEIKKRKEDEKNEINYGRVKK